jgi:hypothetical protein
MIKAAEVWSGNFDPEPLLAEYLSPWRHHGYLGENSSVIPIGCLAENLTLLSIDFRYYLYGVMIPSQHTVYASPSHCTEEEYYYRLHDNCSEGLGSV